VWSVIEDLYWKLNNNYGGKKAHIRIVRALVDDRTSGTSSEGSSSSSISTPAVVSLSMGKGTDGQLLVGIGIIPQRIEFVTNSCYYFICFRYYIVHV
jgi:hypothetical protein